MGKKLEGQIAVITGANSGVGASAAKMFSEEGAVVVITARRMEPLEKVAAEIAAKGGEALPVSVDVSNEEQVKALFEQVMAKYGRVDILVNCAGVLDNNTSLHKVEDELFNKVLNINTLGVFHCLREAVPYMREAKKGTIVNVASVAGYYGFGAAAYAASKGAVIALTKSTAVRYGDDGIRCNCICPAGIDTPMTSKEAMANTDLEQVKAILANTNTAVSNTSAEEQAQVLLFLASNDSAAINGQAIVTDRGANL